MLRTSLVAILSACLGGCGQKLLNLLTPSSGYQLHSGVAYGEHPRHKLDVYVPDNLEQPAPVVVFFYGGRWSEGDRAGFKFVAQALTDAGCIAVLPDYRLYPEVKFPAFIEDGAAAVAWVHENINEYQGDVSSLYLMGHSAGAHIAAMLTLDKKFLRAVGGSTNWIAGFIGLAGPYDFLPLKADDLKDMFGPPAHYPASQPINFVTAGAPPVLLIHGEADQTVLPKNSRNLAAKLQGVSETVTYKTYEGMGHIKLIAALAAPLQWLAPVREDVRAFIGPGPEKQR